MTSPSRKLNNSTEEGQEEGDDDDWAEDLIWGDSNRESDTEAISSIRSASSTKLKSMPSSPFLIEELFFAAENGDEIAIFDTLKEQQSIDLEETQDKHGRTLLHIAAQAGHFGIVSRLAVVGLQRDRERSINSLLDSQDNEGFTPLHYACAGGTSTHFRTAQVLIHLGANVTIKTKTHFDTALHLLVRRSILAKSTDLDLPPNSSTLPGSRLLLIDPLGTRELLVLLTSKGADINATNSFGDSPLHEACYYGREQCAIYLLNSGADLFLQNKNGEIALHLALPTGKLSIIALLAGRGQLEILQNMESNREPLQRKTDLLEQLNCIIEQKKELKYFVFPEIIDKRYFVGEQVSCYAKQDLRTVGVGLWKDTIKNAKPLEDCRVAVEKNTMERVVTRRLRPSDEEKARIDVAIRKNVVHSNLLKVKEVVAENPNSLNASIWVMNEFFDGCRLHEYVRLRGRLDEAEAKYLFTQVVSAVLYAHRLHLLYRELLVDYIPYMKPENIFLSFGKMPSPKVLPPLSSLDPKLASKPRKARKGQQAPRKGSILLTSSSDQNNFTLKRMLSKSFNPASVAAALYPQVKVGLFGYSKSLHPSSMATSYYVYAAPEVASETSAHNQAYGPCIDSWTCGVMLYIMITGGFPFAGEDEEDHHQLILQGKWTRNHEALDNNSPYLTDLISQLLLPNPTERMQLANVLKHPWFTSTHSSPNLPSTSHSATPHVTLSGIVTSPLGPFVSSLELSNLASASSPTLTIQSTTPTTQQRPLSGRFNNVSHPNTSNGVVF